MRKIIVVLTLFVCALPAHAFLEDLCLPRKGQTDALSWCLRPTCPGPPTVTPNRACPAQVADFASIQPGRSMLHHDGTYFIAQALGYRSDVAYWIAAYNEVADYGLYAPIDQCGGMASASNSGANYMAAPFNGFKRTNTTTDGPLDHYVVSFSPNGTGTDVHGPAGVSALYPLAYPKPGYPEHIDDVYQKTLANLRQWALIPTNDPGLLCTLGLTTADGTGCVTGSIGGNVPFFVRLNRPSIATITAAAGKKILDNSADVVYYDQLETWMATKSSGKLWEQSNPVPVPVQLARIGLYLHVLQDTSSHATYCGDNAPSPPGGGDPGTFMYMKDAQTVQVSFGNSCANSPHLAGHVQETGTGNNPLPLRDYVALNNTVDELIVFGNRVAKQQQGWIVNPELLPPDVTGGKNAQGFSAADLKNALVGTTQGVPYSGVEVYQSGIVALPLQQTSTLDRLHAMNTALGNYSNTARAQSRNPDAFVPFEPLPGNSFSASDTSVCWK